MARRAVTPVRVGSRLNAGLVALLTASSLSACSSGPATPTAASPGIQPSPVPRLTASALPSPGRSSDVATTQRPRPSGRPILGGVPPPWLGTRPLPVAANGLGQVRPTPPELVQRRFTLPDSLPQLPGEGFASRVATPAPTSVIARSTWRRACPVAASDLSWLRLAFWGFDGQRHTGELLVSNAAVPALVAVFGRLYGARFPIEEMRITRRDEQGAAPTGDGNNTGSFDCRAAVGATTYSQHAYGLAVDVNPFQNPYTKADVVIPELASSYVDRSWLRSGMITPTGPVVRAFDSVGWTWGGTFHSLKDLQHFSQNGG